MKNQLPEAKDCLERACPLMELLPLALGDVKDNAFLETSTLSSELGIPGVINENTGRVTDGDVGRRNMHIDDAETTYDYAAGCYALLKDVYGKIYGRKGSEPGNGGNRELKAKNNEDIPHTRVGRMKVREDKETAGNKLAMSMSKPSTRLTNQDYAKVCSNRVSDCSVPESFRIKQEIGKKPQSFKLKSPENFTRDYPWNTKEEIFVTSFDRKNTRNVHAVGCIVKVCTTDNAGSAVNKDADEYPSSLLFSPADDNFREEEAEEIFDIQKKIEDLRSPFEHLREELSLVDENHSSKIDDLNHDDEYNVFQDETVNSNSQSMQSIEFLPSSTSDLHKVKASNTDPVISYTHEIASHLEQMLRKFSQTDASSSARRDILRSVKRFFEDLDIQYPGVRLLNTYCHQYQCCKTS